MRKTKNKWKTDNCGSCGEKHSNYTGKLDKDNIEYVVCGSTNKKIKVPGYTYQLETYSKTKKIKEMFNIILDYILLKSRK